MRNCMQAHVTAKPHKQEQSTMQTHIHVTSTMGIHAEAAYVQCMHADRKCFRNHRSNTHGVNVRIYSSDFSHKNKSAPPLSRSPADRGQSFGDCLALPLFGTPCVSMSAPVQMHMACHTWSLATTTHGPVPQPAVTDKCPHTVWLSDQSVWVTKTGPRADSAPVNCHFLLSGSSLSCLLDPTYGSVFI